MEALILAGGKGSRLESVTKNEIPKPLVELCGQPLIERIIENLKAQGIETVYISVGHLKEKIIEKLGNGGKYGVKINYLIEDTPLGSGGALFYLKNKLKDDLFICSGDLLFDISIERMHAFHTRKNSLITLLTHPNSHPFDSDLVIADGDCRVTGFDSKNNTRDYFYDNLVNSGIFIVGKTALDYFEKPQKVNMEKDFISHFIDNGGGVYSYFSTEYVKDMGTPERLEIGRADLLNNLPQKKNLANKQRCIFLDRDGTINRYNGFVTSEDKLVVLKNAVKAIGLINKSEYLAIVITNQPVVARGECSMERLNSIHNKMKTVLGENGCYVDAVYFCPHHPHSGFEGEVRELKIDCNCRKPKIGLIEKAVADFNIDLAHSVFIGDSAVDVQTGINAGIRTIKVKSSHKEDVQSHPTKHADNLLAAVKIVLKDK